MNENRADVNQPIEMPLDIIDPTIRRVVLPSVNGLREIGMNSLNYLPGSTSSAVFSGRDRDFIRQDLGIKHVSPIYMELTFAKGASYRDSSNFTGWFASDQNTKDLMVEELAVVVAEWVGKQLNDHEE